MKEISYRQVAFVVLCSLFFLPCHANYVADNDPTFRLSCATPDSMDISQLNLYNTDMERFPSEILKKNNIRFKKRKINVANYGKCYYYILQFKHYSGVYLNGKINILYCPLKKEYFVFGESVSDISTEDGFLLITNNCRGNVTYDRLVYSKELSCFLLECGR